MVQNVVRSFLLSATIGFAGFTLAQGAHAVGSAGCGLGSILFKDNAWWKQVLAATTNATSGTQTFGITTGTSNCAPGLFGEQQKQRDYMTSNLSTLQREIAQGGGETVNGLASVMGCSEGTYQEFGEYTQLRYSTIFASNEPDAVLNNLRGEILKSEDLTRSCKLVNI